MKTRLIFLVLLIASYSCATNKIVSDFEKSKIKEEVKEVVNTIFNSAQEANFDKAIEPWLDSSDFVYINNGKTFTYKEFVDTMKPVFDALINQKITFADEKFAFLDNSTVLYTTNSTWKKNFKDGISIFQDPMAQLFIFKKIDGRWRVIYCVESYVEKSALNSGISSELNQVELHKQFIGNWKGQEAKDTTVFWDVKSYGTGLECYFKYVTKGKIIMDGKQLWGYDKSADKFIMYEMIKGINNAIYSSFFILKNKCEMFPFSNISNPENAPLKWELEFKSNDMFIKTTIGKSIPIKTVTYIRVKK